MGCVARIYGIPLALGVPVRAVYANILNSAATIEASRRFAWARLHRRPLRWLKTEHAYPSRAVLLSHKRPLGEILTSGGYLRTAILEEALKTCPTGVRLGEHLIDTGRLTVRALYEALSFQQGLPLASIDAREVRPEIARALPEHLLRRWQVLPFKTSEGALYLASPEVPSVEMTTHLAQFTKLELRFHLLPAQEFHSLTAALLEWLCVAASGAVQ
jgi:hypothetical protein